MQSKTKSFLHATRAASRKTQIRNWIILVLAVILFVVGLRLLSGIGRTSEISASVLPCYAHQDVTPFGDGVLYYDGASIHCVSSTGSVRWSFRIGASAQFSVGKNHLVAWEGSQLYILNRNGKPTYNENMPGTVQFARVGEKFAVVVVGEDTEPQLLLKDLQGAEVDIIEPEVFDGMLMLDAGFYGENGQYMWTLAMDLYGTSVSTKMNLFQVGKMNLGIVSLGENLAYKVLFDNNLLRVFTTQQMYSYDYKGVQHVEDTMLVYGWKFLDSHIPARGNASMLLAPTAQTNSTLSITELRVLSGTMDRRYTLPSSCVGAAIEGSNIYAFSPTYLYRTNVDSQRFYAYAMPLPEHLTVSTFIGLTDDSKAVVTSGDSVYTVTLPK
ncbi:MAG: hypothetical protein E7333_04440 [Clostridiales bacterium]|nr:hypothetical protein [Clostridiales bacterium]